MSSSISIILFRASDRIVSIATKLLKTLCRPSVAFDNAPHESVFTDRLVGTEQLSRKILLGSGDIRQFASNYETREIVYNGKIIFFRRRNRTTPAQYSGTYENET